MTSLSLRDLHPPGVPANDRLQVDRPWTEQEDFILLSKSPAYGVGAVAQRLGRTAKAGYHRHLKLLNKE